ncbi:MAG TPA: YlxR family protein, partial [Candidatus Limnocylindria bacterium]|nr:YlxR family protein [Candidatus Limnocylindria bacterium]
MRIVRSPSGELSVDLRGKAAGRGAYCDPDTTCLERGLSEGAIARALDVTIDADTAERLRREMGEAARVRV